MTDIYDNLHEPEKPAENSFNMTTDCKRLLYFFI